MADLFAAEAAIRAAEISGMFNVLAAIVSAIVGVVVGVLGAFNFLRKNERKIEIENIVKERCKWRNFIRKWLVDVATSQLSDKEKNRLKSEIVSRVNMDDKNDESIIKTLDAFFLSSDDEIRKTELSRLQNEISALLKEDWERVKLETMPIYRPVKLFRQWWKVKTIREKILKSFGYI